MGEHRVHGCAGRRLPILATVPPILLGVAGVCAVCLAAPSDLRAACGDYATRGLKPPELPSHAISLPSGRALHADEHTPGVPAQPNSPCQGPYCSRRVPLSPVTPEPVVSRTGQEWGWIAPPLLIAESPDRLRLLPQPGRRPLRLAQFIYHPPRAVSPRLSS